MKILSSLILVVGMIFGSIYGQDSAQSDAQKKIEATIQEFGGDAFLNWKDYTGSGRYFIIQNGKKGWTKFWEEYKYKGKSRTNFNKREGEVVEIFNLELNKGWDVEYGEVKEKKIEEVQRYASSERRNLLTLFKERYDEDGMKVFFFGPDSFDTIEPLEALEFVDADNFSVTVYYEEGKAQPFKMSYKERNPAGIMVQKEEMYFRWFVKDGVRTPLRVEFHTNGQLTGLVEYDDLKYNANLSDEIFLRPFPKE